MLISTFSEVPSGSLSGILALCVVGSRRIGLSKIFTRLGGSPGRFSMLRLAHVVAWVVVREPMQLSRPWLTARGG